MIRDIFITIIMFVVSYFIVIGVHESGHVLMGLFQGFKFLLFVIGPFGLKRDDNDKVVFYLEKNPSLWGGIAATSPISQNEDNIKKFANVLIAGPVLSLLFGLVCLFAFLHYSWNFLLIPAAMSLGIFVATIIPFPLRVGFFYTDGARWLRIKRNKKDRLIELVLFNIMQSYYENKNYSKINISEVQYLIEDDDFSNKFLGHYYLMLYFKDNLDTENEEKQIEILKSFESKVPKSFFKILNYDQY